MVYRSLLDTDSCVLQSDKNSWQLPDAAISYFPNFLTENESLALYNHFKNTLKWQNNKITLFGKEHTVPRLEVFYGDAGLQYTYSGKTFNTVEWNKELFEIKSKIEKKIDNTTFNSVLVNYYRDGNDSNGWHADNEKSLGLNPVIASLSLGYSRDFLIRHREFEEHRYKIALTNGSLLIMSGSMQHKWLHQIPRRKKVHDGRINLTFRKIVS